MNIEHLIITSDFELIINQVNIQRYKIKKEKLKLNVKRVNELIEYFCSFNISFVPGEKNQKVDSLALVASLSNLDDIQSKSLFQVKIILRPSVPDNQKYLQVFENDKELNDLLANENDCEENDNNVVSISKDYVKSKSLFTTDDQAKNRKEEVSTRKVQETKKINIGTEDSPKYVNLGIDCTTEEIDQYIALFK